MSGPDHFVTGDKRSGWATYMVGLDVAAAFDGGPLGKLEDTMESHEDSKDRGPQADHSELSWGRRLGRYSAARIDRLVARRRGSFVSIAMGHAREQYGGAREMRTDKRYLQPIFRHQPRKTSKRER